MSNNRGVMVRLFSTVVGLRCALDAYRQAAPDLEAQPLPLSIGLVPTMGALHEGHMSLIHRARRDNDVVVVSIFVNPLQFGPQEDLQQYPKTLDRDRLQCAAAGVDLIFAPTVADLYGEEPAGDRLTQVIPPRSLVDRLCGLARPGHFEGVATVVTKLLNIVQPHRAYFGQKDAQQLAIIRQLVADLNLPVDICGCSIVREASGLAYSSRNQYLSEEERSQAAVLYRSLQRAEAQFRQGVRQRDDLLAAVQQDLETDAGVQPEYIDLVHPRTMAPLDQIDDVGLVAIAARIGSTRLIDNLLLRNRAPIVAIDGPAGAGKSTVVRRVAQELGLLYLDTGAMYRAVTWLALHEGLDLQDEAAIAELVSQCEIQLLPSPDVAQACQVQINGHDVTQAIRTAEVTDQVSAIAAQPYVRKALVQQQQRYGRQGGVIMEGRDIGTHVFPHAELKLFLTASVQERARRRQQDLKNQGQGTPALDDLEQSIYERDRKDSTRVIAPLRKADDAIELQTDHLTIEDVTAQIVRLYHERISPNPEQTP
ncbi:MAG TPA: bifunctional pantoate--beta-alanine ligase/(d)CMP kinase [Candidatus Obscuribacterales bacterium]